MFEDSVKRYVHELITDLPESTKIVARFYANVNGLAETCFKAGIVPSPQVMKDFVKGFTQGRTLFDFVDVGSGKDRADKKIIGESILVRATSLSKSDGRTPGEISGEIGAKNSSPSSFDCLAPKSLDVQSSMIRTNLQQRHSSFTLISIIADIFYLAARTTTALLDYWRITFLTSLFRAGSLSLKASPLRKNLPTCHSCTANLAPYLGIKSSWCHLLCHHGLSLAATLSLRVTNFHSAMET